MPASRAVRRRLKRERSTKRAALRASLTLQPPTPLIPARLLAQQVRQQVVELALGNLLGPVRRHRRQRRPLAHVYRRLFDALLLALRVGDDDDLPLFAQNQPAQLLAALEQQRRRAERLIDVAVR